MRTFELPEIEILKLDISDVVTASYNELIGWAGFDENGDEIETN